MFYLFTQYFCIVLLLWLCFTTDLEVVFQNNSKYSKIIFMACEENSEF